MTIGSRVPEVAYDGPRHCWWESLLKALCYRVFMVALTVGVAFLVTSDTVAALQIGIVTNLLKTGTYYGYERLWDRLRFGGLQDG
jgi:uncharacterized membrane protein